MITIDYKKYAANQKDWAENLTKRYEDAGEDETVGAALRAICRMIELSGRRHLEV